MVSSGLRRNMNNNEEGKLTKKSNFGPPGKAGWKSSALEYVVEQPVSGSSRPPHLQTFETFIIHVTTVILNIVYTE